MVVFMDPRGYILRPRRERERESEGGREGGRGGGDYFNARVYASKCSKSWFAF